MATNRKNASADAAEKKQYAVLSRLDHDGDTYLPGDTVELHPRDAGVLLTLGVVAETEPAKA